MGRSQDLGVVINTRYFEYGFSILITGNYIKTVIRQKFLPPYKSYLAHKRRLIRPGYIKYRFVAEEKLSYSDKLKNPLWQRKRLEIFQRDNWTCKSCRRTDVSLHIHHLKYFPSLEPWEYSNEYLVTYCEFCHNTEHLIGDKINKTLLDLIRENSFYIKPVSQLCILVDEWPVFADLLRDFVNESMITYLRTLEKTPNV